MRDDGTQSSRETGLTAGSRGLLIALVLAAVMAMVLMAVLGIGCLRDNRSLEAKTRELEESRKTWERIAAEKETLQEELGVVTDQLKEARLTLEESTTRAEELREENSALEKEIEALRGGGAAGE